MKNIELSRLPGTGPDHGEEAFIREARRRRRAAGSGTVAPQAPPVVPADPEVVI